MKNKIDLSKVDPEVIIHFTNKIEKVRKQRNQYLKELKQTEKKLEFYKPKTPMLLIYKDHSFWRYLKDNPYAEEMKCKCGFVIPACQNEDEIKKWIKQSQIKLGNCK